MDWKTDVTHFLETTLAKPIIIQSISGIGGGSINNAYRLGTSEGIFFIKINSAACYPQMFEKEALGLKVLSEAGEIPVPELIGFGENGDHAFLVLTYLQTGVYATDFWEDFGTRLARLHQHSQPVFGLQHDNYIGSLYQSNRKHSSWPEFFIEERLSPQIHIAIGHGRIEKRDIRAFELFFKKIGEIFPKEPPALLHGDLWSGNFMANEEGKAIIIDPAVYYGHREMDLGMSQLFGGFHPRFYESYNNTFPLEPGWPKRLDYCNLYPLLVHLNLFGSSYLSSIRATLRSFI